MKAGGGKSPSGAKGSKKLREILSTDMISPPLGDFRHMAHVGRGGSDDMFGDTSFLQKGNSTLPMSARKSDSNIANGSSGFKRGGSVGKKEKSLKKGRATSESYEQSATLDRFKRKKNKAEKSQISRGGADDGEIVPSLQNALSLPILSSNDCENEPSSDRSHTSDQSHESTKNAFLKRSEQICSDDVFNTGTPDQENRNMTQKPPDGPPKPRRTISTKSNPTSESKQANDAESNAVASEPPISVQENGKASGHHIAQQDENDGWEFNIDLGPSLLDEIMGVVDWRPKNAS